MKKQLSLIMLGLLLISIMAFLPYTAHSYTPADYQTSIINAANRLIALQSPTDYGWDWVVTGLTSHSANPSASNLYGVTAQGLIDAYELTGNASYLTAAENSGNFMKYGDPSAGDFWNGYGDYSWGYATDYIFLVSLTAVSGNASYRTYALAAWAWQKANLSRYADGNQSILWDRYRDDWIGTNMSGAAALGTSEWGLAALEMGDTAWAQHMAVVIDANMANILSADVSSDYKDMGMGETLKFLVTLDPVTYASDIASLKTALAADQLSDGSWDYGPPPPGDPQTTAYVVSGLWTAGEYTLASQGADWLVTNQLANGGWSVYGDEYSEPDSEMTQATFTATSYASALYISPSSVAKTPSDVGTNFTVAVTLSDFGNLMGFDIELTWDGSLISNVQVDKTPLNALWPAGSDVVYEQSGVGLYELAAASISTAASNAGASVLFTLTFQVITNSSNFPLSTPIHFNLVKLSDNATPTPNPIIPTTVTDGAYTMSGMVPDLEFTVRWWNGSAFAPASGSPYHFECSQMFLIDIYVTSVVNLTGYNLIINFDQTLVAFNGNYDPGIFSSNNAVYSYGASSVQVYGSGSAWTGSKGLLITLAFLVEFAATPDHIWNSAPTHPNYETFPISITGATLTFTTGTISFSGISIPAPLTIEIDFIRGDVDCNGVVNIADISDVAYYYGKTAPAQYNLNSDTVIDIYDIVIIATNYGYSAPGSVWFP